MKYFVLCIIVGLAAGNARIQDERFLRELEELWERAEGEAATDLGEPVEVEPEDEKVLTHQRRGSNSCTAKYQAMKASTMCDYQDDPGIKDVGVDENTKKDILKLHNDHRAGVSPSPSNMQKMYWDDELAAVAQKWANTCVSGHDRNDQRQVPKWEIWVGQNWAGGQKSWKEAIDAWHSEVKDFTYGGNNPLHVVGHYTQVVNSNAGAVGCGFANCANRAFKENYVCNYAFGQEDINKPYKSGNKCADCPGNCANGLCDCKGMVCKNGGKLNVDGCKCECPDHAVGDLCDKMNCKPDPEHCGQELPWGFPKSTCAKWTNVPKECPNMCGKC